MTSPIVSFGTPLFLNSSLQSAAGLAEFGLMPWNTTSAYRYGPWAGIQTNVNSDAASNRILESVAGVQRAAFEQTGNGVAGIALYTRLCSPAIYYTDARGFQCMFSLKTLENVRFFVGECDSTPPLGSDAFSTPSGYFGLNYSTALGHTTWHVASDGANSTSPTRVDTGVPVSTDVLVYDHKTYDGTTFKVTLYDPESRTILYQGEKSTTPPRHFPSLPPDYCSMGAMQLDNAPVTTRVYYAVCYPVVPFGYDL